MIIATLASTRPPLRRIALIALGCAFSLALIPMQTLKGADGAALQPLADKAPSLPLTATFEKVTGGENGPFVLKLKNDSKDAVKVTTKILLSVAFHADSKAKHLPAHTIKAGQVWSIPDLAAADKLILTAEGFAPLEIVVP
jgi:hypothetical protein